MQKRGALEPSHHLLLFLFELFVVSMVFIGLLQYVDSIEQDTLFEKSYMSKDLALLVNTIQAAPGDVNYVYTHPKLPLTDFVFSFQDGRATIAELWHSEEYGLQEGQHVYYPFADDANIQMPMFEIEAPNSLVMRYSSDKLLINPDHAEEVHECPDINTQSERVAHVVVDPGKGEDTRFGSATYGHGTGAVNLDDPSIKEQDITKRIANSLLTLMVGAQFPKVSKTRQDDEFVSIPDRREIIGEADLLLSLHTGSDRTEDYDRVTAYVYSGSTDRIRSIRLACLILKEFESAFGINRTDIRMLDAADMGPDDPYKVLQRERTSVVLEIGNIQYSQGLLSKPAIQLAKPIHDALLKHYG
jgi:N-acetylmuramoyl-L-alanine amidase